MKEIRREEGSPKQLRMLGIFAHPDDFEQKMGGVAYQAIQNGHEVIMVVATNGENGTKEYQAENALSARRHTETAQAAQILGMQRDPIFLNGKDALLGVLKTEQEKVLFSLVELIRKECPDVIVTHALNDFSHDDHAVLARLVKTARRLSEYPNIATESPPLSRGHTITILYGEPEDGKDERGQYVDMGIFVEIDEEAQRAKQNAFLAHSESQGLEETPAQGQLSHWDRTKRLGEARAMQVGVQFAEAFSEVHESNYPPPPIDRHPLVHMMPGKVYVLSASTKSF